MRARTYDRFVRAVLEPRAREADRPLSILDLGAGNGWLSARAIGMGHRAVAVDLRLDDVDGLAAGAPYARHLPRMFGRVAASFEELPLAPRSFDVALFNAALHYAESLPAALGAAARAVRPGGRIAILDSPFYRRGEDGESMRKEKLASTRRLFPALADDLLAVSSIEYLTRELLAEAARPLGLLFRRRRVVYPLWYELRPLEALLSRRRTPSRFDLWDAVVP